MKLKIHLTLKVTVPDYMKKKSSGVFESKEPKMCFKFYGKWIPGIFLIFGMKSQQLLKLI